MIKTPVSKEVIIILLIMLFLAHNVIADKIIIGDPVTTVISSSVEETCKPITTETWITREECVNWTMSSFQEPECNLIGNVTKPHFETIQECSRTMYGGPVYYDDGSGYEIIDSAIVDKSLIISGRDYIFGVDKGIYQAYFRNLSSDVADRPMAISQNGYVLTFSPQDTISYSPKKYTAEGRVGDRQQSRAIINDNQIIYPGQYGEIGTSNSFANLSYKYYPDQLKEELIIWNQTYLINRFNSQCNADEGNITNLVFPSIIRAYKDEDNDSATMGIFYGSDRQSFKNFGLSGNGEFTTNEEVYFTDENDITVYYIPVLYAYDSNQSTIILNKTISMTNFNNLKIEVLVPYNWLNKTEITYPVYIDPTITLNTPDVQIMDDAHVNAYFPTNNYGSEAALYIGNDTYFGDYWESYIKFNLSSLTDISVTSAYLKLYVNNAGIWPSNGFNVTFYKAKNNWTEEGIDYNNKTPIEIYQSDKMFFNSSSSDKTFYAWNITNITAQALSEGLNNVSLAGKILDWTNPTGSGYVRIHASSKEDTNASKRPSMNITYTYTANQTITNCTYLDSPGITYFLDNDISSTNFTTCMDIIANNTVLDCQGHSITTNTLTTNFGISVDEGIRSIGGLFNITIKNCTLNDWYYGIYVVADPGELDNFLANNTAINRSDVGVYVMVDALIFGQKTRVSFANMIIENSSIKDFDYTPGSQSSTCPVLTNVSGTDYKPIIIYNSSVNVTDWVNNVSMLGLCFSDNSTLRNITFNGANMIKIAYSRNVNISGINISNTQIKKVGFGIQDPTGASFSIAGGLYGNSENISVHNVSINNITGYGLYVTSTNNFNLRNISINYSTVGMYLSLSGETINDVTINNSGKAFKPSSSSNIVISNMSLYNNNYSWDVSSSSYVQVYNTLFKDKAYGKPGSSTGNLLFNTTLQEGTRIFGTGSLVGGNYWSNPTGTGFSDNCTDADNDGICDNPFNVTSGTSCTLGVDCGLDVDYLPLSDVSWQYNMSVDISSPSPNNFSNDNTSDIQFTVRNLFSNTTNCSISINGSYYGNNDSVVNNTLTTITMDSALVDNNYSLMVNCTDYLTNYWNTTAQVIVIDATPPTVVTAANLNLTTAYANSTLGCNVTFSDANSFKSFNYAFYVNNTEIYINTSSSIINNTLFWTNSFKGNFSRNDNVSCNFTITDIANNIITSGTQITITNTAPVPDNVTIIPTPATILDELYCHYNYTDNDNDALVTTYYNWTLDGVLSAEHNQNLGAGNLTGISYVNCSVMSWDGYDNSTEWFTSPTINLADITPPVLSGTYISQSVGFTTGVYTIYANCTDTESSIANNYPKVNFNDPLGNLQGNFTMNQLTLDQYSLSASFTTEGLYDNFTFYCRDAQSNLVTLTDSTMTFLSGTATTTPGGGGGRSETQVVIQNITLASFCGDGICDADENPLTCSQDCSINVESAITCLFNDPKSCFYSDTWFLTVIFIVIIIIGVVMIYLGVSDKEPRWIKKWF